MKTMVLGILYYMSCCQYIMFPLAAVKAGSWSTCQCELWILGDLLDAACVLEMKEEQTCLVGTGEVDEEDSQCLGIGNFLKGKG